MILSSLFQGTYPWDCMERKSLPNLREEGEKTYKRNCRITRSNNGTSYTGEKPITPLIHRPIVQERWANFLENSVKIYSKRWIDLLQSGLSILALLCWHQMIQVQFQFMASATSRMTWAMHPRFSLAIGTMD